MKRLLLPLIAALALPTAVNAGVAPEVHKIVSSRSRLHRLREGSIW